MEGDQCMPGGVHAAKVDDENVVFSFNKALELGNQKNNTNLQLVKIVKATVQVVAGTIVEGDMETNDGVYHIKIWSRPWMNAYELQEFKKL